MRSFSTLTFFTLTVFSSFAMAQSRQAFVVKTQESLNDAAAKHKITVDCDLSRIDHFDCIEGSRKLVLLPNSLPNFEKFRSAAIAIRFVRKNFKLRLSEDAPPTSYVMEIPYDVSWNELYEFFSGPNNYLTTSLIVQINDKLARLNEIYGSVSCHMSLTLEQCDEGLDTLLDIGIVGEPDQQKRLKLNIHTENEALTMQKFVSEQIRN